MNRSNALTISLWLALCIFSIVNIYIFVSSNKEEYSKLQEQVKIDGQKYQAQREQYQQKIKEYDKATQNINKTIQELTKSTNQIRSKQGLPPCIVQNGVMVCPDK